MPSIDKSTPRIAAVVLLLGAGAAIWLAMAKEPRPSPTPTAPSPPSVAAERPAAPAPPKPSRSDAWQTKRERIRTAWAGRRAAPVEGPEPAPVGHCTEGCWGSLELQLRLAGAVDGCRELLPADARGKARLRAHVLAEPELGAVVESVEVLEDGIGVADFTECLVEAAQLAELVDPTSPVSDDFVFRFTAGPPGDNAADFLGAHPDLVERFPRLAALLERPADAPRSDEDATAFAQIISTDEEAMAAFSRWTVEQGVDLSNVRVDDP